MNNSSAISPVKSITVVSSSVDIETASGLTTSTCTDSSSFVFAGDIGFSIAILHPAC